MLPYPQHNEFKGKTLGESWDPFIKHQDPLVFNPDWSLVTLDEDASHAPNTCVLHALLTSFKQQGYSPISVVNSQ